MSNSSLSLTIPTAPNNTVVANISGFVQAPSASALTTIIDATIGSNQGNVLFRNGSVWSVLAPGTNGQVLTTGGTNANISWTTVSGGTGGGSVNSVSTGTGLTGGPITSTGTISMGTSGVTAGTYTNANITVDALGRILAAANGSGGGGGGGGVSSITAGPGLTGGIITSAGTISLNLSLQNTWNAPQYVAINTLTFGTTVSWNAALIQNASFTATSNFVLANPSGLVAGAGGMLTIYQDTTGSRVITWSNFYKFPGGMPFQLSTTANAVDDFAWYSPDGTNVHISGLLAFG